jgi:hypothetical protein
MKIRSLAWLCALSLPFAARAQDEDALGDSAFEELPDPSQGSAPAAPSAPKPAPLSPVPVTPAPKPSVAPPAPVAPVESEELLTPPDAELPADVKELEDRLKAPPSGLPSALIDSDEPGGDLRPSEKFSRIPLRPQMSDRNWVRWAGPALEKSYRIRGGDTLWGISERLFGNPYLWPKVWQLNAHIGNPNIIEKGVELQFKPGNPNSAPELAYRDQVAGIDSSGVLPLGASTRKIGLFEYIDDTLRSQIQADRPPFQYFLLDSNPKAAGSLPRPADRERIFYQEGEEFRTSVPAGEYVIARVTPVRGEVVNAAYRVRWIGTAEVERGGRGRVLRAFSELGEGDLLLSRQFVVSPLALHEEALGEDLRRRTRFLPLQEGSENFGSQFSLMGVRFPSSETGPRLGAILSVSRDGKKVATLLLVDRDGRVGTVWVVESEREISFNDKID